MAIRDIVEARIQKLKRQREAVVKFFKSCKKGEVVLDSLSIDFHDFFKNKTIEQLVEEYTNMTKNIKVSEGAYWVFDYIEYTNNSEVLIVLKRPETDEEYNKRTGAIETEEKLRSIDEEIKSLEKDLDKFK